MFDLETAIAEWRTQMLATGIKSPVPLEELEIHVRDHIAEQLRAGLSEPGAFGCAIRQTGEPPKLKTEFKKIENKLMKRKIAISAGIVCLLLGTMMILPALGKHNQRNQAAISTGASYFAASWANDELYGLEWGVSLAAIGAGAVLLTLRKRKV